MDPSATTRAPTIDPVPKKKKQPRRPITQAQLQSPLRVGGRALGDLQVPFRTFLEREASEDDPLTPADTEARLMESLGWLLIAEGEKPAASSATYFHAAELHELFTVVVPHVAGDNDLWADELQEETMFSWLQFLSFLDATGEWDGSTEEVLDCLHVAEGGNPPGEEMVALYAAAADVTVEQQEHDLALLPSSAGAAAVLAGFADGVAVTSPEDPGAAGREVLAAAAPWVPAEALWADLVLSDLVLVRDGTARTNPRTGSGGHFLGSLALESHLGSVLDELPGAEPALAAVLRAGVLRRDVPDVDQLTDRLVAAGILTDDTPRAVPAGLLPTVVSFVRNLERLQDEQRVAAREEALEKVQESALGLPAAAPS